MRLVVRESAHFGSPVVFWRIGVCFIAVAFCLTPPRPASSGTSPEAAPEVKAAPSIKVFRAKWSRNGETIKLFVELRDANCPGSTYNLQYHPASDRLKGTYFQAVEKQT